MSARSLLVAKNALDLSVTEERKLRDELLAKHGANRHGRRAADRELKAWKAKQLKKAKKTTAP